MSEKTHWPAGGYPTRALEIDAVALKVNTEPLKADAALLNADAEPWVMVPLAGNLAAKDCAQKTKDRKRSETDIACPFAATAYPI